MDKNSKVYNDLKKQCRKCIFKETLFFIFLLSFLIIEVTYE